MAQTLSAFKQLIGPVATNEGWVKVYKVGGNNNFVNVALKMVRTGPIASGDSNVSLLTKKANVTDLSAISIPASTPFNDIQLVADDNNVAFEKLLLGVGDELWVKVTGTPVAVSGTALEENNVMLETCGMLGALTNASTTNVYDVVNLSTNPGIKMATLGLTVYNPSHTDVAEIYVYLANGSTPVAEDDLVEHRKLAPGETFNSEGIIMASYQRLSVKSSVANTEFNANGIIHKAS